MKISSSGRAAIDVMYEDNDEEFGRLVERTLGEIGSKPSGGRLLEDLAEVSGKTGKRVLIRRSELHSRALPALDPNQVEKLKPKTISENVALAGQFARKYGGVRGDGSSAVIMWNPLDKVDVDENGVAAFRPGTGGEPFVLGHELIHAKRFMKGNAEVPVGDRQDLDSPRGREEARAIGLGEFSGRATSENALRAEHGLRLRTSHASFED
ncbi:hypothetical protein G3O00_38800 [Burkholderia sp. Ac-20384]|uniref:M91 family zinc metallopeptidase n=1 Tax=Burkholderia sp. Ac-20384 TaxID=2703902 RepID=UPI00197EFB9A|nr:M91 family zinc metallopeptidase [Burkholderia sp. Ac-20384]MBN3829505.1 hypothetical protein [Burkholderia sp. Ac-20384]